VQEVLMEQPLTPVPRAPEFVLGLLNLRGQIMTAIDLRRRLDFPAREAERKQSVIVLRVLDAPVSVLVDEIGDVLALPVSSWMGPPETLSPSHRRFVTAICPVEGQVVLGLNVRKLLEPVEGEMRGHG
jgi:purine-binding chemotaxis protein CheW